VKLIVANGQCFHIHASAQIQIGYTRAARLVDMMELRGIVGRWTGQSPANPDEPRRSRAMFMGNKE
jgi:DNA segregation ATPase FtsK/SpoIIIE-like protein